MPRRKQKRTKKTSRETGDDVSSDAGWLMSMRRKGFVFFAVKGGKGAFAVNVTQAVEGCMGSALSQDQTKGPRKRKGRRKK